MPPDEIEKVFPGAAKYNRYNLGYSGVEAIAKLKAYEEKQKADELKVGDVVTIKSFDKHAFVVTKVSDESVWGVDANGCWNYWAINEVTKTDKHFDIEKILDEMKHED